MCIVDLQVLLLVDHRCCVRGRVLKMHCCVKLFYCVLLLKDALYGLHGGYTRPRELPLLLCLLVGAFMLFCLASLSPSLWWFAASYYPGLSVILRG